MTCEVEGDLNSEAPFWPGEGVWLLDLREGIVHANKRNHACGDCQQVRRQQCRRASTRSLVVFLWTQLMR